MQEEARIKIAAREAASAKESEAIRIVNDKKLIEIKKLNDEVQKKRDIAERDREKKLAAEKLAAEKARYEADMRLRFGPTWQPPVTSGLAAKVTLTPIQQVETNIKLVTSLYTEDRQPGMAKNCLKTCLTFMQNVIKDPANEKFRKVNLQNEKI